MSADDEKIVQDLERASLVKDGDANFNVIRCDLSHNDDQELNGLWLSVKEKTEAKLPMIVARSLKGGGGGRTINLLLSTDWNDALFGNGSEGPPPSAAAGNGQRKSPEFVPIPSGRKRSPAGRHVGSNASPAERSRASTRDA